FEPLLGELRDRLRVILDVESHVMEPLAVLPQVVGEDARSVARLNELELHAVLPRQRVPEREPGRVAVTGHVLQDIFGELLRLARPDAQKAPIGAIRRFEVAADHSALLDPTFVRLRQGDHPTASGSSPRAALVASW